MSLAIEFARARILQPIKRTRPMTPSVNWLEVRGLRAEERAEIGRKRKPQPAIGMARGEQTPMKFLDDKGSVVALHKDDPENQPKPPAEILSEYEQVKRVRRVVWVHKTTGVLWRPEKRKVRDAKGYASQAGQKRGEREERKSVTLSSGVGEIIDLWRVDFSDNEIHGELAIMPSSRVCRAVDEESGSFCCSSRSMDGSSYCSNHRARYTRASPHTPLRLGKLV